MSFDKIFDLTAGVYFYFYNIHTRRTFVHQQGSPRGEYEVFLMKNTVDVPRQNATGEPGDPVLNEARLTIVAG